MSRFLLTFIIYLVVVLPSFADNGKTKEADPYVLKVRGVMESFADISDGLEERLDYYSGNGFTHYFYCPSDDRYSNAWGWKILYNDGDRHFLKELQEKCGRYGLEFVWTVTPGDGYRWTPDDYEFLKNKLIMMYYGGLHSFAVNFSDDGSGWKAVKDSLDVHFVHARKKKPSLYMVDEIPVAYFPSQGDAAMTIMSGYHFDDHFSKKAIDCSSVICVLKDRSELSRIALTAVTDFALDPERYNPDVSMVNGLERLSPGAREVLTTFLSHTGGECESDNMETFTLETWSEDKAAALLEEFRRIEAVPSEMEKCKSPALRKALKPWMDEFGGLGRRGRMTIECLEHYLKGDVGAFWLSYMDNRMSGEELVSYQRHSVGSVKLHPFYVNMMRELADAFTAKITAGKALVNLASTLYASPNAALDSDLMTALKSEGGIEFPIPAEANTCRLLTGSLPEDSVVLFRQIGTDGQLVAEFVLKSPYSEFDLKEGAVKVDVIGDIDIYESIFVYL